MILFEAVLAWQTRTLLLLVSYTLLHSHTVYRVFARQTEDSKRSASQPATELS